MENKVLIYASDPFSSLARRSCDNITEIINKFKKINIINFCILFRKEDDISLKKIKCLKKKGFKFDYLFFEDELASAGIEVPNYNIDINDRMLNLIIKTEEINITYGSREYCHANSCFDIR